MIRGASLFFFIFFFLNPCWAGSVFVPLHRDQAPAKDLLYRGAPIDPSQALALKHQGIDLSTLSPGPSQVWQPETLPLLPESHTLMPQDGGRVVFEAPLKHTSGLFRNSVVSQDQRFWTLTVSLDNHSACLRSALFRLLGYPLESPRYYHALTITFTDVAARDLFLNELERRTLTARTRWIRALPANLPEVTLQGVVLEPGRIDTYALHWGAMEARRLQGRRAMRASLLPVIWGELSEDLTQWEWEPGQIFDDSLVLRQLFAGEYGELTLDDVRWIVRRIALLSREEITQATLTTRLPGEVQALIVEKLISRRNHWITLTRLNDEYPSLAFDWDKGTLTRFDYPGYPWTFGKAAVPSPIRRTEIYQYFRLAMIGAGLQELIRNVNLKIPGQLPDKVIADHQKDLQRKAQEHELQQSLLGGESKPFSKPVGFWGGPTGSLQTQAGRSVGMGTYYGSDAPLQLIDSLGASLSLGAFAGYDGLNVRKDVPVVPSFQANLSLSRNYVHLRPISSLQKGLESPWAQLMVSRFMEELGGILDPNPKCELDKEPMWVQEKGFEEIKTFEISYLVDSPEGGRQAQRKQDELLAKGIPAARIILLPLMKDQACPSWVQTKIEKSLSKFLDTLKVGESFMIIDSLSAGVSAQVSVPIAVLIGQPVDPNWQIGVDTSTQHAILRRTHLIRTPSGFQVYLQTLESTGGSYGGSLSYYLKMIKAPKTLARLSQTHLDGDGHTRFFQVALQDTKLDEKRKAMTALQSLLVDHESELLVDSFPFYELTHDLSARVVNHSVLYKKWDKLREDHTVAILPPKNDEQRFDPKDFKRTLYQHRTVDRNGNHPFNLLSDVLSVLSDNRITLDSSPPGVNPAYTPFGSAEWSEITAEGEITGDRQNGTVFITENVWAGWALSKRKLFDLFNAIEERVLPLNFNQPVIHRGTFALIERLELYEVRSTLILFPEAVLKLGLALFERKAQAINTLYHLFGKDQCEVALTAQARLIRGGVIECHSGALGDLLTLRTELPDSPTERIRWVHSFCKLILENAQLDRLSAFIGRENFLFSVKVSGFKTPDSEGTSQYLSSTIGKYDSKRGLGIFRDLSTQTGISPYELYAKYFANGF